MERKSNLRKKYREHLEFVASERDAYAKNREMAERGEAISIGMDATAVYATVSKIFACQWSPK